RMSAANVEVRGTGRRLPRSVRQLTRSYSFWLGGGIVVALLIVAALGPALVSGDPFAMQVRQRLQPPSQEHALGTDEFGRDVLVRLVHGSRLTLKVGVLSVGIALMVGGLLGILSGFVGGWFDVSVMG